MKSMIIAAGVALAFSVPAVAQISPPTQIQVQAAPAPPGTVSAAPGSYTVVIAPTAPPAPEAENRPPPPSPTMVWQSGHWAWDPVNAHYVWDAGQYVAPPTVAAAWMAGHWEARPGGWSWIDGHWN